MKSAVIYASRYGNTRRVAEAIAEGLHTYGDVELFPADEAPTLAADELDFIVIGGPTEIHHMTQPISRLFARLRRGALTNVSGAAFDTRVRGARLLTGSAAVGIERKLRQLGARLIAAPESFFVAGNSTPATGEISDLESGEAERAKRWAASLGETVAARLSSAPVSHA